MDNTAATSAQPANLFRRLRIKSRQIMLLDALDEHRNLRRAAAAINTTQPAATALLQQLEEGLGVLLFERHARGMEPTVYGEVMIRYARGVLHDFAYAGDEMAALAAGAAGLVRIGSVMGGTPVLLTQGLARFKAGNPRVRISLQVDTSDLLMPALLRGDLDVVLGRLPDQFYDEDLEIEQLEGESMSVVARPGHPLFDLGEISLADLVAQTWILHPLGSPMRRRVAQGGFKVTAEELRPLVHDAQPAEEVSFMGRICAGLGGEVFSNDGTCQPGGAPRHRRDLVDPGDHLASRSQRHDLGGAAGRGAALCQLWHGRHRSSAPAYFHGQPGHHHAQEKRSVARGQGLSARAARQHAGTANRPLISSPIGAGAVRCRETARATRTPTNPRRCALSAPIQY